jgi:hypothetical protein
MLSVKQGNKIQWFRFVYSNNSCISAFSARNSGASQTSFGAVGGRASQSASSFDGGQNESVDTDENPGVILPPVATSSLVLRISAPGYLERLVQVGSPYYLSPLVDSVMLKRADNDYAEMINSYIKNVGKLAFFNPVNTKDSVSFDTDAVPGFQGVTMSCTKKMVSIEDSSDDLIAFDAPTGILYPGALISGQSILSGNYSNVLLPRAPMTITIVGPVFADKNVSSRLVDNPEKFSQVNEAVNGFWSYAFHGTPAISSEISYSQVYSLEQANKSFGLHVNSKALAHLCLDFEISSTKSVEKNVVIMCLKQSFYDITVDKPSTPAAIFGPGVTMDDLKVITGEGNPLAYVKSVKYGRIIYVSFESSASGTSLELLAKVCAGSATWSVAASGGYSQSDIESNTTIRVFGMGGNASDMIPLSTSVNDIKTLITGLLGNSALTPVNQGVPLEYTFGYLCDGTLFTIRQSTNYSYIECNAQQDVLVKITPANFRSIIPTGITVRPGEKIQRFSVPQHPWLKFSWTEVTGNAGECDPLVPGDCDGWAPLITETKACRYDYQGFYQNGDGTVGGWSSLIPATGEAPWMYPDPLSPVMKPLLQIGSGSESGTFLDAEGSVSASGPLYVRLNLARVEDMGDGAGHLYTIRDDNGQPVPIAVSDTLGITLRKKFSFSGSF